MRPYSLGGVWPFLLINNFKIMALRIKVGTKASASKGVTGRRSLTGGSGQFVTRDQKYRQVRRGLGLSPS